MKLQDKTNFIIKERQEEFTVAKLMAIFLRFIEAIISSLPMARHSVLYSPSLTASESNEQERAG